MISSRSLYASYTIPQAAECCSLTLLNTIFLDPNTFIYNFPPIALHSSVMPKEMCHEI